MNHEVQGPRTPDNPLGVWICDLIPSGDGHIP
jgi:hypothetical protein